jgi:signal peptidase I
MKTDTARKQANFVLRYALQSFGLIVVLAVLIRIFLISSYVMAGASMLPTIWPGDFLIGVKWHLGEPRRGDVVVFRCPAARESNCLRRVIGVAGDRVEFKGGHLVVNRTAAVLRGVGGGFAEESVSGRGWAVWPAPQAEKDRPAVIVPPGFMYVLNDKREDHDDSRRWGPLPVELLEARVSRVWLSLDWYERSGQVRAWPRPRWSRLLRSID